MCIYHSAYVLFSLFRMQNERNIHSTADSLRTRNKMEKAIIYQNVYAHRSTFEMWIWKLCGGKSWSTHTYDMCLLNLIVGPYKSCRRRCCCFFHFDRGNVEIPDEFLKISTLDILSIGDWSIELDTTHSMSYVSMAGMSKQIYIFRWKSHLGNIKYAVRDSSNGHCIANELFHY